MKIGIMQGRLSTPPSGQLQAFPWTDWENEFTTAARLEFDAIEWLFDAPQYAENPIWSAAGRQKIRRVIRESGVGVRSVCAHFFIQGQLSAEVAEDRAAAGNTLRHLIAACADLEADVIVLPLAEQASLAAHAPRAAAMDVLTGIAAELRGSGVTLALEMDLDADGSLDVLAVLDPRAVGLCYDIGNATAAGLRPERELPRLAARLVEVHIKDRAPGGPNVQLGRGTVDFDMARDVLGQIGFDGLAVLETPRGDDPIESGRRHLGFVRQHFGTVPPGEKP